MHELAHALGVGYDQYGREWAEVLVDCVTYIVCSSLGLDVGGEAIPYVGGWGEDGALEALRDYAQTIDAIPRRIEDAVGRDDDGLVVVPAAPDPDDEFGPRATVGRLRRWSTRFAWQSCSGRSR